MLNFFENDSRIKIIKNSIPFEKNYQIVDISLAVKRNHEDRAYKGDPLVQGYLRRGTSFLINNSNPFWARKGLPKFFNLPIKFLSADNVENPLFPLKNTFRKLIEGSEILVFKTIKANGENAQISYINSLNSWIIGSKNVCLAARTKKDLEKYNSLRFNYAKLIADIWFRILEDLDSKEIENLKLEMEDATFVGEYVGNKNCQHIVEYKEENIQFFAIVKHQSDFACANPDTAFRIFKKFRLSYVNYEKIGTYFSIEELSLSLCQISKNIGQSSLDDEKEGSVFYFVAQENCINLCKVKTTEYKVLRKLREKAKNIIGQSELFEKTLFEFNQYLKQIEMINNQQYEKYINLAKRILKEASINNSSLSALQNNFITCITNQKPREIYISIGIPGIGKTNLLKSLLIKYPDMKLISSDDIRKQLMDVLRENNPQMTTPDLLSKTTNDYKRIFNERVKESTGRVYIDKNFPPNSIKNFINLVRDDHTTVTAFVPRCGSTNIDEKFWPMSLEVLYTCILRIISRKNHETLNSTNVENLRILFLMFSFYRGYNFNYYIKSGIKSIASINFVDESILIPEIVREKLAHILRESKPGTYPSNDNIEELLSLILPTELSFPVLTIVESKEQIPVFLGIEISAIPVIPIIVAALSLLLKSFDDDRSIMYDVNAFKDNNLSFSPDKLITESWKFPSSLHVTTLFIGKNSKVLHSIHYTSFNEGIEYSMNLLHLIYIPSKIIFATIEFLNNSPCIANKIPHLTMLLGKLPSKASNEILEAISLNDGIFSQKTKYGICYSIQLDKINIQGISKKFF